MYLSITLAAGVGGDHWTKDPRRPDAFLRGSELVEREAMISAAARLPPRMAHGSSVSSRHRPEDHHGREGRDLEAAEEREETEQQVPVALGNGEEAGAGAAAPARPTRIPSQSTFCRVRAISSEHGAPARGLTDLPGATGNGA
jgi:hypothetical protein